MSTGTVLPEDVRKAKVEAIKLLSDWSKWLVVVETAAITGIGGMIFLGKVHVEPCGARWLAIACTLIGCILFVASIYFACVLLASLSNLLQKVHGIPGYPPEIGSIARSENILGVIVKHPCLTLDCLLLRQYWCRSSSG
jgi:hypothetical protein